MPASHPFRLVTSAVVWFGLMGIAAAADPPAPGGRYALLVGVHAYKRTELTNLPYPEKDVTDLAGVLAAGGYRRENIRIMTASAAGEDPDLYPEGAKIRRQIELMLADRDESDTVIIALSGHGLQFLGDSEDDAYFCPADARLADRSTLISLREAYRALEGCRAGLKLLLVDACRDDPAATNSRAFARARLESVSRPQRLAAPGGVIALYSCSMGQRSYDHEGGHGAFFHYVIAGLRGEAARDPALGVTVPDLESYVKRKVDDYVRARYGERQMPEIVGGARGLLPIVGPGRSEGSPPRRSLEEFAEQDSVGAHPSLVEVMRRHPGLAATLALRKRVQVPRKELDRARIEAERAISQDPGLAVGYLALGTVRVATAQQYPIVNWQSQYQEAIADYSRAIELDPRLALSYSGRGRAYNCLNQRERAVEDLDRAISLAPDLAEAYCYRGVARREMRQYLNALADLDESIRLDPAFAPAYFERGQCRVFLGARHALPMIADHEKACRLDPTWGAAEAARDNSYSSLGLLGPADVDEVIRLNPRASAAFISRAVYFQKIKMYDRAFADYRQAIRLGTFQGSAYHNRALLYIELKRYGPATDDFTRGIEIQPNPEIYNDRGLCYLEQHLYGKAITDFDEAIRLAPSYTAAYRNRGAAYAAQGLSERAQSDATKAAQLEATDEDE